MNNIPEIYLPTVKAITITMRQFLAEGRELHAIAFLGTMDGRLIDIPMNTENDQTKDAAAHLVSLISKQLKPDFAIVISEAWALMKDTPREEIDKIIEQHKSISEHPDRQEVVFLTLETRQGIWMGTSPIKSLGEDKRGFDDLKFTFATGAEGRFTNFLHADSDIRH